MLGRSVGMLVAASLLAHAHAALAACPVTYSFSSGTTAVSAQVNQNFADLAGCALQAAGGTLTGGTLSGTTNLPSSGTLTSGGKLGIGTTSPNYLTQIHGVSGTHGITQWTNASTGSGVADGGYIGYLNAETVMRIYNSENADTLFANNNAETMRITAGGNVGIGTTTPNGKLTVFASGNTPVPPATYSGTIQIVSNQGSLAADGGLEFLSSPAGVGFGSRILSAATGTVNGLLFQTRHNSASWSDRMFLQSSTGNFGIGVTTPQATLDVNGFMRLAKNATAPAACSSTNDGALALTSQYTLCACNGSSTSWVKASDGTTACAW